MKIKVQTTFNIDIAAERRRLEKAFGGEPEVLARQIALLDAFELRQFSKAMNLYARLPYCENEECHEGEFVCEEIVDFMEFMALYDKSVVKK